MNNCSFASQARYLVQHEAKMAYTDDHAGVVLPDGMKRNAYLHMAWAASMVVLMQDPHAAAGFLAVHEWGSGANPAPWGPALDQADKANNFYGLRIGSGVLAWARSRFISTPLNWVFEKEIYPEIDRQVRAEIDAGRVCLVLPSVAATAATGEPHLLNDFVDPTWCGR